MSDCSLYLLFICGLHVCYFLCNPGVSKAVEHVNQTIAPALISQVSMDGTVLIDSLDGWK